MATLLLMNFEMGRFEEFGPRNATQDEWECYIPEEYKPLFRSSVKVFGDLGIAALDTLTAYYRDTREDAERPAVVLQALEYQWSCPICSKKNVEFRIASIVKCGNCENEFRAEPKW